MTIITIPKELSRNKDLIAVPGNMYAKYIAWLKSMKSEKTFKPTKGDSKSLEKARKNLAKGNFVTLEELENELDRNS